MSACAPSRVDRREARRQGCPHWLGAGRHERSYKHDGPLVPDRLPDIYISNINTFVKDNRYVLPNASTEMKMSPEAMSGIHVVEASLLYLSASKDGQLAHYEESDSVERNAAAG